jgi:hypothetical protein
LFGWSATSLRHTTAIFRQVNKDKPGMHHDALEFSDGQMVLLTELCEGQEATLLQLPAQPATAAEQEAQERVAYTAWYQPVAVKMQTWGRSPFRRPRFSILNSEP